MGGQDGFARDLLAYDTTSDTVMAGLLLRPSKDFDLGLHLVWTDSEAGLAPFDLSADDYVATHPSMQYDFSTSHTYSDLDVSRFDAEVEGTYRFNGGIRMTARYRRAEYEDDAPYLYDTSGSIDIYSLSMAWKF